jgi:hypothetical protein
MQATAQHANYYALPFSGLDHGVLKASLSGNGPLRPHQVIAEARCLNSTQFSLGLQGSSKVTFGPLGLHAVASSHNS